jgi:hypothetical protein
MALEKWALDEGVGILYDTRVCALRLDRNRITHLIVENKSGRSAIACKAVIDATGDADLCALAGETTESLDSNVLCGWFYHLDDGGLSLHSMTNRYSPYATRNNAQGPFFRGDCAEDVTGHILGTRDMIRNEMKELRQRNPDRDIQLINPPTIACMRMTRRLVGTFSLSERNVHEWFDDTVGLTGDWRKPGPVYAIPYRSLVAEKTENLLVAGRCISADASAWDVTRAIPGCAVTGEAVGTAAALALSRTGGDLHAIPPGEIQEQLRRQGAILDPERVKPAYG